MKALTSLLVVMVVMVAVAAEDRQYEALRTYLSSHKASLGPTEVVGSTCAARPGLRVRTGVKAGDVVASVPFALGVTVESLLTGEGEDALSLLQFVNALVQNQLSKDTLAFLSLHLLHDGATGKRTPFLDTLPAQPLGAGSMTAAELAETQAGVQSPLMSSVQAQNASITALHAHLSHVLAAEKRFGQLFGDFSLERFAWVYRTVMNRALVLRAEADGKITMGVFPWLDLVNYANPDDANVLVRPVRVPAGDKADDKADDKDKKEQLVSEIGFDASYRVELVAKRDIAAGEELLLCYSGAAMTNTQLLLQYGVALHDNPFEGVALDVGIAPQDPLGSIKQHIIQKNQLMPAAVVRQNGLLPVQFLHALRVNQLTDHDIRHLYNFQYDFDPKHGYFSLQNELKVNIQLITSIESLLDAQYPTTLRQDLAAGGVECNPPLAYRVAVKRVLHNTILQSFKNLDVVFHNLTARWSQDIKKTLLEDKNQDKKEWREEARVFEEKLAAWKDGIGEWRRQWNDWTSEVVGGSVATPTPTAAPAPAPAPEGKEKEEEGNEQTTN